MLCTECNECNVQKWGTLLKSLSSKELWQIWWNIMHCQYNAFSFSVEYFGSVNKLNNELI